MMAMTVISSMMVNADRERRNMLSSIFPNIGKYILRVSKDWKTEGGRARELDIHFGRLDYAAGLV